MHNIKDFGAVGDGIALDTMAIQAAIDAGGEVYIPDGVYRTGTLYLKSNGGLLLSAGARLLASHDREDYNSTDFCPQNQVFESESVSDTHLIAAVEQENVFISGFGTIDGDSHYWVNESCRESVCGFWGHTPTGANSPAQMLYFVECKNVRVENVTLLNSPFWHIFFHGCTDVHARGLTIHGERRQWGNDGIGIDCCSNVIVSDCLIDTGDNGINLRANGRPLVGKTPICENILITDCVITSYLDYGIHLGVGDGVIRSCVLSNLIIRDSLLGIGMTCRFSPEGACTSIEDIRFDNITIEAKQAFDLKISNAPTFPPLRNFGYIRDIDFRNVSMRTKRCCHILGFDGAECTDIVFRDCRLVFTPDDPNDERYSCEFSGLGRIYSAVFVSKCENVVFNRTEFIKDSLYTYDVMLERSNVVNKGILLQMKERVPYYLDDEIEIHQLEDDF